MTIVAGSLYRDSWKTVFSIVQSSFTLGSTYSAFPDTYQASELSFPLATIDNPENTQERTTFPANSLHTSELIFPVTIYTKSRASIDQGADEINKGLKSNSDVLLASGLHTLTVVDAGGGTEIYGKDRIHFKTLSVGLNFTG